MTEKCQFKYLQIF